MNEMTDFYDVDLPMDENDHKRNDPNDLKDFDSYLDELLRREKPMNYEQNNKKPDFNWLDEFKLTPDEANELSDPEWVYEDLIIKSHLIVIPAAPGAGKTTILMHIAGELASKYNVVYVNADVGGGDIKVMQAMADKRGFHLLLPDMKAGLTMNDVVERMEKMNESKADYSDTVFFFDTLKKMTDVINKSKAKQLLGMLRGLTAKGMTIILLAHTNKYDDKEGCPIYEGTGDLRSDVDDLIYLIPKKNDDGSLTVSSDPLSATSKRRGNHQPITFKISPDRKVSKIANFIDTAKAVMETKLREKDETVIDAIIEALAAGKCKHVEIIDWCREKHLIGRRTTERVLKRYSSRDWHRERGFNNSWNYELVQ